MSAFELQSLIFGRFVAQKVKPLKVENLAQDIQDGTLLVRLMEAMSDEKFTGKLAANPKMAAQRLDNVSQALKFTWSCGVKMSNPPSNDDIVQGNLKPILGLVWAIMLKYWRIEGDDDTESLSAKDALLLWAKNKTAGYDGVQVDNLTKSFHNGLAFAALIHKHRPKAIDFASLSADDAAGNLTKVMAAAEKFFGLEQYLKPEHIALLDENSMTVYLGDYYVAIAEAQKLDLAARKIGKVIKLTEENDKAKKEYNEIAAQFQGLKTKNQAMLEDRTIDNTMAGAKAKLQEFYDYKAKDKNVIVAHQLDLDARYSNLAQILKHNNRPEFQPADGMTVPVINDGVSALEKLEQERKVELHAELNRQLRLVDLDKQHTARFDLLKTWWTAKEAYLQTREDIQSIGAAQLQLRRLDAYEAEYKAIFGERVPALKTIGAELGKEKYEKQAEVESREKSTDEAFALLEKLCGEKRPVLDDALAREEFKAKVRLQVKEHSDAQSNIMAWAALKSEYLQAKEEIDSVADARAALSILDACDKEVARNTESSVASLKTLGADIRAQKYETQYSQWVYEKPDEVTGLESAVDAKLGELQSQSEAKRKVLDEDLARELEKERLRMEFAHLASMFSRWCNDGVEEANQAHFGFSLEEVEAYAATLEKIEGAVKADGEAKKGEYEGIFKQGQDLGVKENAYTEATLESLAGERTKLDEACAARRSLYEHVLAHEREVDRLCKEFAAAAEGFQKSLLDTKTAVMSSSAALEEQLKFVEGKIASATDAADGAAIATIKDLDGQLVAKDVINNRHTTLTLIDVEALWAQYKTFLEGKRTMLATEIERQVMRGVSKEQFDEIEGNFERFDKDKSGQIDRKELKACMYSLGQEKKKSEIEEILTKYGDGKAINLEGFRELMISILGVSDTKDDILQAYAMINQEKESESVADKEKLENVLADHDLEYMAKNAKTEGSGYNYPAFTEDLFSR